MSIIKAIYNYFNDCPILNPESRINIDYLPDEAREYTIDTVPCNPVIKKYIDGSSKRRYLFIFASKEIYGDDFVQNADNLAFYEKLCDYIEEQSNAGILPILTEGESQRLEVLSSGYAINSEHQVARYQIQCQLIYLKSK